MGKIRVSNMTSPRSGREVANQFIINTPEAMYFQSYQTVIVKAVKNAHGFSQIYLDPRWNCSRTTSKYRATFLGETTEETKHKVDTGEYIITNLN